MKGTVLKLAAALVLAWWVVPAISAAESASPGVFSFTGPTSANGDVIAIRWRYSFRFSVDTKTIKQVRFSCEPIPGTTLTVKGPDLVFDARGYAFAETAAIPVGETTTPWLLDPETTSATCAVIVTDLKGKTSRADAQVSYPAETKLAMLLQLEQAFKYSHPPKAANTPATQ